MNCYAERFVKSIKSECLNQLILSSVDQLEYVLGQYSAYYHRERIHQSLDRIIEPKHALDDYAGMNSCTLPRRSIAENAPIL